MVFGGSETCDEILGRRMSPNRNDTRTADVIMRGTVATVRSRRLLFDRRRLNGIHSAGNTVTIISVMEGGKDPTKKK